MYLPPYPVVQATTIHDKPRAQAEWLRALYIAPAMGDRFTSYKPYTSDNKHAEHANHPTITVNYKTIFNS